MTRTCYLCRSTNRITLQDIPPKCCSEPEDYYKLPLCQDCHNKGKKCSNSVLAKLMNRIGTTKPQITTSVNGISVQANIGSISPEYNLPIPSGTFSTMFINKQTKKENDFRMIRNDNMLSPSGCNFQDEWLSYGFLIKKTR